MSPSDMMLSWMKLLVLVITPSSCIRRELFCPPDFQLRGSSCYQYHKTDQNYTVANKACKRLGAKLAEPRDRSKNEEVYDITRKILQQYNPSRRNVPGSIWIGATDSLKEGRFTWVSDGQDLYWTNWGFGQPDNWDEGNCVEMYVPHWTKPGDFSLGNKQWADIDCNLKRDYLCEAEPLPGDDTVKEKVVSDGMMCRFSVLVTVFSMLISTASLH